MNEPKIEVEFDCPYCGKLVKVAAELLAPNVQIRCGGCKNLIPAGVFYDEASTTS